MHLLPHSMNFVGDKRRSHGHVTDDEGAAKSIHLALKASSTEWKRPPREWHTVKVHIAIKPEDRLPMA